MRILRFQCPDCGFGDHEIGHITAEAEVYCVVCIEEEGRLVRVHRWEEEGEEAYARLRLADAA
jgi:hypothetical protein